MSRGLSRSAERKWESSGLRRSRIVEPMKRWITAQIRTTPPEAAIAATGWRRTGLLQRLVKHGHPVPTEKTAAQRPS
jgi:hypothetical protein